MNIPNIITIFRLFLIPVFAYFMLMQNYYVSVGILILSGLSDIIDGYIARKFNMITKLGTIMDPVVDKLMQITALGLLVINCKIPLVPVAFCVVFAKELIMLLGGYILYKRNIVVTSNVYGKVATVVIYASIILSIFCYYFDYIGYANIFMIMSVIATLMALIVYFNGFLKLMKNS